jgi:hypothetical protein
MCRFVHQLTIRSGVTVQARPSPTVRGRWQIVWCDGPTVIAMRRLANDLGDAVVGVDPRRIIWQRTTTSPSATDWRTYGDALESLTSRT